jgi:tetraacyldisaccharide-1-P 4'-kinase
VALLALPDHESYTAATQAQIQQLLSQSGADWLLTTEKDGVKLQVTPRSLCASIVIVRMELLFEDTSQLEKILQCYVDKALEAGRQLSS